MVVVVEMSRRSCRRSGEEENASEPENETDNGNESIEIPRSNGQKGDHSHFTCRVARCTRKFKHKNNRCRHEKVCKMGKIQPKEKPSLICSKCNRKFPKKFNLDRHIESGKCWAPKVSKTYNCHVCDKGFATRYRRDRHVLTHTKEKYACEQCDAKYTRLDKFKKHKCAVLQFTGPSCSTFDPEMNPSSHVYSAYVNHDQDDSSSDESFTSLVRKFRDESINNGPLLYTEHFGDREENTHMHDFEIPPGDNMADPGMDAVVPDNEVNYLEEISDSLSEQHDIVETSVTHEEDMDADQVVYLEASDSQVEDMDAAFFHLQVSMALIKKLKYLKQRTEYSSLKRGQFATLFLQVFDGQTVDDHGMFMKTLADELSFESVDDMFQFINTDHHIVKQRGRPPISKDTRQLMYDFWKTSSELSNDRRNARHITKIKRCKLSNHIKDLIDPKISEIRTKQGVKLKAQRRIYSGDVRSLYSSFAKAHPDVKGSVTTFYRCRPYYISPATDREMEGCMCAKCLNPHELYKVARRHLADLPCSLTDYLSDDFSCSLDNDLNFPTIECIKGTCKNSCQIHNDLGEDLEADWGELVSYSQYEKVTERYFDKSTGEEKTYDRTSRRDYTGEERKTLREVYNMLMDCAPQYLEHRYYVTCDKVCWSKFKAETKNPILWLDYSQNIKLTPRTDVQSAYYSGKQQTLHDGLIQMPDGSLKYIYHLSDDTHHDSVMIDQIIRDILSSYPELTSNRELILRSDNCSPQYKCRFVFYNMLKLAKEYNIKIHWFFGEPGHGRGLIDAMAWFGCKGPLRKVIIQTNAWFKNALAMLTHLQNTFANTNKYYHYVDEVENAGIRAAGKRKEHPIHGCRSAHILSFYPDGSVKKVRSLKNMDIIFEENKTVFEDIAEDDGGDDTVDEPYHVTPDDISKYDIIEVDSFVAIKATNGEQFNVYRVKEKQIATENMLDASGEHTILVNEPYLIGSWISYQHENSRYAQYKQSSSSQDALIHVGEVFATDILFDDKMRMSIHDYRVLCCNM